MTSGGSASGLSAAISVYSKDGNNLVKLFI